MKSKRGKIIVAIVILFIFMSGILIYAGIYFNNLAKPVNIYKNILNSSNELIDDYLKVTNHYYDLKNFDIKSVIDVNVESEDYLNKSKTDFSFLPKINYLNNISNMKTTVNLKQDIDAKKAYFSINQVLGEEEILNYKYLIENATEYYFLDNSVNSYINNGSCNYFEALTSDVTFKDNIDYIRNFLVSSINNNLEGKDFNREVVEEEINKEKISVNKTSIEIDDMFLRELFKNVLNDLKADSRSYKILSSFDEDFSKRKIKDKTVFLKNDEKYLVNVYTSKLFSNMLKLEIIYSSNDTRKTYVYEGDYNKGRLYYTVGDSLEYIIDIDFNGRNNKFTIYNNFNKKIGTFLLDYSRDNSNFSFNYDYKDKKIDVVYSDKFDGNKQKVNNIKKLSFKVTENKVNKINGNITIDTSLKNKTSINENLENARLRNSLSLEEEALYKGRKDRIKERLEK